jgi:hypothetical protein
MPDSLVAMQTLLSGVEAVTDLVTDRIFLDELPDAQVSQMPRATLVLSYSGGPNSFENSYQELADDRVDVRCWGKTPQNARDLFAAVYGALFDLRRTTVGDTVIHWAKKSSGPITLRWVDVIFPGQVPDPSLHWPAIHASWQVLFSTVAPQEALA